MRNKRSNAIIIGVVAIIVVVIIVAMVVMNKDSQTVDWSSAVRGDIITFGIYEQDGNLENGAEPIQWIVLKNKDNKLYLMSKYGLDAIPYHTEKTAVEWEKCTLRQWLNNDFYNMAFSEKERAQIVEAEIRNDDNPYYDTEGGNATVDKVFLLSYAEFETQKSEYQLCTATTYGEKQGIVISAEPGIQCEWWLRTPGIEADKATTGSYNEGAQSIGMPVDYEGGAVRPCVYIEY